MSPRSDENAGDQGAPVRSRNLSLLRRLAQLSRPVRGLQLAGIFFLTIASLTGLAYPQGVRMIIDGAAGGAAGGAWVGVGEAALLLTVVAIVQAVAVFLRRMLLGKAGIRVMASLREQLFGRILDQEVAFFDERKTGELMTRLGSDVAVLQGAVSSTIAAALRHTTQVVGGLVLLIYTSPALTALMLTVVPAVAVGAMLFGRLVRRLSRRLSDTMAEANHIADESIGSIRTVKMIGAERQQRERYAAVLARAARQAESRTRFEALFNAVTSAAIYSAAALVLWYGAGLLETRDLTVGQLTTFLMYTVMVAFAFAGVAELWVDLMRTLGAADEVFALLDRPPLIPPAAGATPAGAIGRVQFEQVRFRYPVRQHCEVLRGIDLALEPGEVLALVGPSGAGKSTVTSLLLRFYDPGAGRIRFAGHDLRDLDARWLRAQIGTVEQEPVLFSTTIAENIRCGRPEASREEIEAAAAAANALHFITSLPDGFDTRVGERGVQLSGGQKQRVAIARAVLRDPKLLILDEATSALDSESELLVKEGLTTLMHGRTTLVIAHRLSTVIHANRILVLDQGHIVQTGTHAELAEQGGLYRRLLAGQVLAGSPRSAPSAADARLQGSAP